MYSLLALHGKSAYRPESHKVELVHGKLSELSLRGWGMTWKVSAAVPTGPWWSPGLLEGSKLSLVIADKGNTVRKGKKSNWAKKKYRIWEKRLSVRKKNWEVKQ